MKPNQFLFVLLAALLLTACDAGKYYARKKIDRHYETISESDQTTETVFAPQEKPLEKEIIPVADQHEKENTVRPVTKHDGSNKKQVIVARHQEEQNSTVETREYSELQTIVSSPVAKAEQRPAAARASGLALLLVAILLLLLGLLFLALLGALGFILWIIFLVAALIYLIAALIVLFSGG